MDITDDEIEKAIEAIVARVAPYSAVEPVKDWETDDRITFGEWKAAIRKELRAKAVCQ
jgi:hypothetical protein